MRSKTRSAHARHVAAVVYTALAAFGCGDGQKDTGAAPAKSATTAPNQTTSSAKNERPTPTQGTKAEALPPLTPDAEGVVRLTGNDMMQYNAKRIEVPAGAPVKLELKHIGKQPVTAMGHNFVLLKAGADPMKFAAAAVTASASGYIPPDLNAQVIANTRMVGGGQSDTIEFTVPGPGEYPYLCSFPGHVGLMRGTLIAK